jgi:long-chain acyl-CoA synthetase
MSYPTLAESFLRAIDRTPNARALLHRVGERWEGICSAEVLRRVASLSRALVALGARPGDRVGLFSPNRPEWHIADFAVLGLGAVTVPIYFNEAPERIADILNDSGAGVVIVVGGLQAERLLGCRSHLMSTRHVIVGGAAVETGTDVLRYEALVGGTAADDADKYRHRAADVKPDQLATIIYTSGTTGEPKGVMLSHANLTSNAFDAVRDLDYRPNDVALSFLPLSHVYERIIDYAYLFQGISLAYVERIEEVQKALVEVRPTLTAAVPRFFEKFYANLMEVGHRATGLRRWLFDWAMEVAERAVPWRAYGKSASLGTRLAWDLANGLVYRKIRAGMGGRVRAFSSGGAPLAKELAEFFWSVGVKVYQGYGLTETSPVVSTNSPTANKVGTVGRPIPNVEVRIAEDGEILVRGPCVMQGYYGKPDQTREVLSPDGWLRTGDIGYLDADGYLVVTDRKKDLLKTAAGKFVAPQPIENRLRTSPYILNAAVVGDKRKFVAALIVPNFENVEARALGAGVAFASRAELVADPWTRALVAAEIERLTANLAQYEKIKRFALLDRDFTFDGGELTHTLKIKRRVIEQRYAEVIGSLYADVEEPRPASRA